MLTGMVPFSGSTPIAIAIKHGTEYPRPPKEIVATIPDELESVVLHALEKDPAERPANAAEFRNELLALTEKLGLEHHALISSPDIAALRVAGVESPSGRLVVDLSKLREGRVLSSSGNNEITVIGQPVRQKQPASVPPPAAATITRMEIAAARNTTTNILLVIAIVLIVLMLGVVGLFALRSRSVASDATMNTNAGASPLASPSMSPSPLPTPSPSPSPSARPKASPTPEKKKGNSFVDRVKRILKKPF